MLTERQQTVFEQCRESTHNNEHLSNREEILVGLAAAIALDCDHCVRYYVFKAKKAGIDKSTVSEILAKVMVVSANKKRLRADEVLSHCFGKTLTEDIA